MRDTVSLKRLFLFEIGKTLRHSDVINADVSELTSFPFARICEIDGLEDTENLALIRLLLREKLEG